MIVSRTDLLEQQKANIWKLTENKRLTFQTFGERVIKKALNDQFEPFFNELKNNGNINYDLIKIAPIEKAFITIYTTVGPVFASDSFQGLKSKPLGLEFKRRRRFVPSNVTESVWVEFMKNFALTKAAERIKGITETTRDKIRSVLDKGISEGLGIDKIAKFLKTEWIEITTWRARLIARTEIISASNAGSFIGAQSTGLNLEKEWIATRDKRTRPDHLAADGQRVKMNEKFIVGGSELNYPGDPEGPREEVIMCRCTIGYIKVI